MSPLRRLAWWIRGRLGRGRITREVDEDIRTHIELDAERLRKEGLSSDEALRRARQRFGNQAGIREEMLAIASGASSPSGPSLAESVALHLRHAFRSLRATPGATALVVATLSIAVAVHTLTVAVANTVFFGDGGVSDASRIMSVFGYYASLPEGQREQPLAGVQVARTLDAGSAEAVAGFKSDYFNLTGHGRPRRLDGLRTTPGLFEVAGVQPILGPGFRDVTTGDERVVVVSWRLWQELGADPDLLGTSLQLNGEPYAVAGVMPSGFDFPRREDLPATVRLPRHPDIWVPFVLPDRGPGDMGVVARLRPGATLAAFQGDMEAAVRAYAATVADRLNGQELPYHLRAVPLREQATGPIRPAVTLLVVAATLVLLVAMGNVTGVGVARGEARAGELAVRMALGSGRRGASALIAAESVLLGAVTTVAGVGLAVTLAGIVRGAAPAGMPGVDQLHITVPLMALALAVSLAGAGCLALGSVARVRRWRLGDVLRGSRDAGSRGTRRTGLALITVELAATLVLLSGSVVMVRSVLGLLSVDPGFDPEPVLTAEITLPETSYPDQARTRAVQRAQPAEGADPPVPQFQRALLQRLDAAPGIVAASFVHPLPFGGGQEATVYWVEGQKPFDDLAIVDYTVVSEGYFESMGIPLIQGREFTRADRHDTEPVVVVSQSLADQFPGGKAVGARMKLGGAPEAPYPWLRVVGVVPDVKRTDLVNPARPEMYVHVSQGGYTSLSTSRLVVRVADGMAPTDAVSAIRASLADMDPDVPLENVQPMNDLLAEAMGRVRFTARLVLGFAILSLLITALGLYSAISYAATSRRRELAVRVALGASSGEVLGTVLGETVTALVAGLLLGAGGVYLTSGLLRGLVYGVAPFEPISFMAAVGILCATVLLAAQGPARTSLRMDPARVLARD